ncbi:MAG: TolC family protein [Bacteroidaceae bacterium]|nr:TolC family protein [Bacteroidaceae bacterium]
MLRNPQLQQQKAQQNFYAAKQRVDQLMGYPSFGLGVKYSWVDKRMGDVIPVTSMNGKNMIMPMLSISLPLYRSKYNAMKRETRFNEQAASKQYQELQIRLEAQYMELLNELSDADRSIDLYAQQATLANTTYQLMLDEYATEKTTLSAIIEVQKQLLRYQFDQLAAISHYNTIVASLEKIVSQQPLINTTHENK